MIAPSSHLRFQKYNLFHTPLSRPQTISNHAFGLWFSFQVSLALFFAHFLTFIIQMQARKNRQRAHKTIKRRIIKHGRIFTQKPNKNCPKLIIGHCFYLFKQQILLGCDEQEKAHAEESFDMVHLWIQSKLRDYLSRAHLIELFGPAISQRLQIRNFINSKIFYKFLSQKALELIFENKKIGDPISYLVCLEKFTARLANPSLAKKVQFK